MSLLAISFQDISRHRKRGNMEQTILLLSIEDLSKLFVSALPVGFLVGCIPMIIGVAIHGIVGIFKKA